MPRLVIVSNRLPVSVKKVDGTLEFYPSAGGLATGLSSYAKSGRNRWIGWPGIASDELDESEMSQVRRELRKHNCYPVFLTQKQLDGFYNGYSNSVLWPLFHHLGVETGDSQANWRCYREVNQLFAAAVTELATNADRIWVHDYQLMLLPEMLRITWPKTRIGFFLHIPFPAPELFLETTHARELAQGLLGADVIGMHTTAYVEKFLAACMELDIGVVGPRKVVLPERIVRVTDFPIGINYGHFADAAKSLEVNVEYRKLLWKYRGKKVILTIDRLDPSKGLVGRLKAYRTLLKENPDLHGKVVMVMQAMPSRTDIPAYQRLRIEVDKLADQIQREYGNKRWQPLELIFSTMPFAKYAALYRRADVAFIAPIRDGMNLVAKEYLASHPKQDGILVLSETAGAAEELKESILVNPYKPRTLVNGLQDALSMTPSDISHRAGIMQRYLKAHTIDKWAEGFMQTLELPLSRPSLRFTRTVTSRIRHDIAAEYRESRQRLLLLDYDGTLQPIVQRPEDAKPSRITITTLRKLATDGKNHVVVISGRSRKNLTEWLGDLPVTLVAEHGGFVRLKGYKNWKKTSQNSLAWEKLVLPILERYTNLTPGAFVEKKEWSIAWHYRDASPYYAQKHLVILKKLLRPIARAAQLEVRENKKVLEIHHIDVSKGHITQEWLLGDEDFLLAIGDDNTDEDMFAALPEYAYTMKVGRGTTSAAYRLKNVDEVHEFLRKL